MMRLGNGKHSEASLREVTVAFSFAEERHMLRLRHGTSAARMSVHVVGMLEGHLP